MHMSGVVIVLGMNQKSPGPAATANAAAGSSGKGGGSRARYSEGLPGARTWLPHAVGSGGCSLECPSGSSDAQFSAVESPCGSWCSSRAAQIWVGCSRPRCLLYFFEMHGPHRQWSGQVVFNAMSAALLQQIMIQRATGVEPAAAADAAAGQLRGGGGSGSRARRLPWLKCGIGRPCMRLVTHCRLLPQMSA